MSSDFFCDASELQTCRTVTLSSGTIGFSRGSGDIAYLWTKEPVYDLATAQEVRLELEAKVTKPDGHVIIAVSGNRGKWHEPEKDAVTLLHREATGGP